MTTQKQILAMVKLPRGASAWVERTSYGILQARADFHPDDPVAILIIGTAKECWKAVSSTQRAIRNNRLGRVVFGKHAPLDYPESHIASRTLSTLSTIRKG